MLWFYKETTLLLTRILTTVNGIQVKTATTEYRNNGIMNRLDRIISTIEN